MSRLDSSELSGLSEFAHRKWGLSIDDSKRIIVENRIQELRRRFPIDSVKGLIQDLEQGRSSQLELALFDVLSTNHTSFFREDIHYDLLVDEILRPARKRSGGVRLWSAGCSRGCEPYTLSILLHEILDKPVARNDRILATDLSIGALRAAREGRYTKQEIAGVSEDRLRTHFQREEQRGAVSYLVNDEIKRPVSLNMLNLLDRWPMNGPFDAVLCRNVMIYFDRPTRIKLAQRFLSLVKPGGLLFVGTSETLTDYGLAVDALCVGAYRKHGKAA